MADAPETAPLDVVLARLDGDALDHLTRLAVDHVLDRPLEALVDPTWMAEQVQLALQAATDDARTRQWLQARIAELRARVPSGTPKEHLPAEVIEPLTAVVARPIVFDRALVGRLLDHDGARYLVTDILTQGLEGFARKLAPMSQAVSSTVQKSRTFGRLRRLGTNVSTLGEGLLGGMSKELEHRAEARIREFVDDVLHTAMDQVADHICDPVNAPRFGAYRSHVLAVFLDTDNTVLASEVDKLDPNHIVDVALGTAKSVAHRDDLRDELARAIAAALSENEGRTLRDWLSEAGLEELSEERFRSGLEARLAGEIRAFVATDAFRGWLTELMRPA